MSWKYFFGRDQVSHDGFKVSAYEGRNDNCLKEPTIEVVYGKFVLEAVRQMFHESFRDIFKLSKESSIFVKILAFLLRNASENSLICKILFESLHYTTVTATCTHGHIAVIVIDGINMNASEAKKDITEVLNNGIIPDALLQAKYSLMFDYETFEIDSVESCFAEIHQRNDRFHFIPICSFRGYSDQLNISAKEINSLSCDLTKLLVFISQILTKYHGPKNYLENIPKNYSRQFMLIEQINTACMGFIDSLKNGPVHKMEKEIIKFATQLTQLENIIRGTTIGDDNGHEMIRECVKNLKPLFCANLIPNSEAWIKVEDSRLLLSEERENWKKRVIWPLGEEIPGYYDEGELSQYSWILDSEFKGKELRLVINREEYYFGIAQVEEEGWGDKVSSKKLVNYLKYQFQDKDELCKSITCPCSPQKKRLWLCERCLWFMRMIGPIGVSCRCKKTTTKKMKVYCNGCKTDKLAEVKPNEEINIAEQQKKLNEMDSSANNDQIENKKTESPKTNVLEKRNSEESKAETPPAVTFRASAPKKVGLLARLSREMSESKATSPTSEKNEYNLGKTIKSSEQSTFAVEKNIKEDKSAKEGDNINDFKKNNEKLKLNNGNPNSESDKEHRQDDKKGLTSPTQRSPEQQNNKPSELHDPVTGKMNPSQALSSKSNDSKNKENNLTKPSTSETVSGVLAVNKKENLKPIANNNTKKRDIKSNSKVSSAPPKVTSEWDKTVIVYEEHETISLPKEFTIIFLGESGVGKSTLISGLGNYLNWPTFKEAKKNQMQVCIPLQFKVQRRGVDKKIIETIVTAGDPEDNENFNDTGQSVTQQPKVHQFTFQENTVKFIDTPGLSDSRGAEQDKENLRLIREFIHDQKKIHAICIVLKSNDARLRPEFELALRDLLSLFPKPALKNVFFFFTYASGTFFGIGDSTGPVKEMQKKIQDSHEETYSFEGENTCAVDSESFKFLLCKERGVKYSNRPEEDFDFCWNESAAQVKDFLTFIKTVKPIEKETTLAVHHLVTTALNLEEFIRTTDQLTPKKREELMKEAKFILNIARNHSMITEYHRLGKNLKSVDIENKNYFDQLKKFQKCCSDVKLTINFDELRKSLESCLSDSSK